MDKPETRIDEAAEYSVFFFVVWYFSFINTGITIGDFFKDTRPDKGCWISIFQPLKLVEHLVLRFWILRFYILSNGIPAIGGFVGFDVHVVLRAPLQIL
jgi:hypothetical protein